MQVRQLEYFEAVSRLASFRRAAGELGVSEPSISQGIRALEQELRTELFERSRRTVVMTAAGHALMARADRILREIRAARLELSDFAGLYRGKLVIGAAPITIGYVGLLDVVTRYNQLYPNIDLSISQYQAEQLMPMIANGAVDIGMLFVPSTGLSLLASLEVIPLFKTEVCAVMRADHPQATQSEIDLHSLRDERLILSAPGTASRTTVEHAMQTAGIEPDTTPYMAGDGSLAMRMIEEGLGIGFSLRGFVPSAHPELKEVRIVGGDLACTAALLLEKRGPRTKAIRAFLDLTAMRDWGPPVAPVSART